MSTADKVPKQTSTVEAERWTIAESSARPMVLMTSGSAEMTDEQCPKTKEIPMTNSEHPFAVLMRDLASPSGIWSLGFPWCLGIGHLNISPALARGFLPAGPSADHSIPADRSATARASSFPAAPFAPAVWLLRLSPAT